MTAGAQATLVLLLPEAVLAAGIPLVLLADMVLPARRQHWIGWLGAVTAALALVAALCGSPGAAGDLLAVDGLATLARPGIAAIAALVLVATAGEPAREDRGAFAACVLGVALGASVMALSTHLLPLWLGIETASLAGYALAAWQGGDRRAAEAGMKFVLFGGLASAVMLFGISHVYGCTGHLDFAGIGGALAGLPAIAIAALALAGAGVAYKLAVVPFHFYAPDVYAGAPALSLAAASIAPKLGAAVALARALPVVVGPPVVAAAAVGEVLAAIAIASLAVAAFTALVQRDAKRIVGFSGIGHAGTAVLALGCLPGGGAVGAALFQLLAYAAASLGALLCLAVLEGDRGTCRLDGLRGAGAERPWVVAALCLCLFSLAGVPPLAGFLGKWGVLKEALGFGLGDARPELAVAALVLLVTTAVSAWSYLLIVRAVVLDPAPAAPVARVRLAPGTAVVLALLAAATVALGLWLDGIGAAMAVGGR